MTNYFLLSSIRPEGPLCDAERDLLQIAKFIVDVYQRWDGMRPKAYGLLCAFRILSDLSKWIRSFPRITKICLGYLVLTICGLVLWSTHLTRPSGV